MITILIIDDDVIVLQLLQLFLENEGYQVFSAKSGPVGLELARKYAPDLVLLDLVMPVMGGMETFRRLRDLDVYSVMMMSHRQDEQSAVKAIQMGADDYLRKPVDLHILRAKIHAMLRRSANYLQSQFLSYDDGHLMIDLEHRRIAIEGQSVKLTPTEFRLLSILVKRAGRVVSHEELIQEVWGTDKQVSLGSLKLYIHYLRNKIEQQPRKPQYLLAEWGIGYRFKQASAPIIAQSKRTA